MGKTGWKSVYGSLLALVVLAGTALGNGINVTTNAGDWNDGAIWSLGRRPLPGDDVTVTKAVVVSNATDYLSSFTITNATLTFTNWDTTISATIMTIKNNGKLTCAGPFTNNVMSNRVSIVCSNLTIKVGGAIDVSGKGYKGGDLNSQWIGSGTGGGGGGTTQRGGGGYGGQGGWNSGSKGAPYGTVAGPMYPGSGGGGYSSGSGVGGNGGGLVHVAATGEIALDGSISANGASGDNYCGGGSGGGVLLVCRTFSGKGSISANGGNNVNVSGGGGGGRIAVHYDAAAQAQVTPRPDVVISTKKGAGYPVANAGQMGTLHFTNTYFLQSAIKLSGYLFFNEGTAWGTDSLTVSNMDVAFPVNFALTVTSNLTVRDGGNLTLRDAIDGSNSFQARNLMLTNGILSVSNYTGVSFQQDVSVSGAGGALNVWASPLDIGQDLAINGGTMRYSFVSTNPHSLHFGGNLELTNGAALHLYAGPTNSIAGSFHGGLLDLSGKNLVIPTNCVLYPYSNPTNGGSIKMAVNNLTVGAGGSINANGKGYKGGDSRSQYKGYGTGGSAPRGGGGYGGQGGKSGGAPYGTVAGPMYPGSGGGGFSTYAYVGGNAGGLVHVEATGAITLDGKIFVNGLSGDSYCGGGSGGGVLLVCRTFSGNGSIYAKGGHYSNANCGGGGGGRIAIWTKVTGEIYQRVWNGLMPGSVAISTNTLPAAFTGSFGNSVFLDGGLGSATAYNGQPGTFRWLDYSGNGTIIMVH